MEVVAEKSRGFGLKDLLGQISESCSNPSTRQFCVYVGAPVECSYDCKKCQADLSKDAAQVAKGQRPKDRLRKA